MKFRIFFLLIAGLFLSSCNDSEVNEVSKEYYSLTDNKDSIGEILGQHDLVILGEVIHDSEDIFNHKVELMKHLVESEGFNFIMLEGAEAELEYYKNKDYPVQEGLNHIYRKDNFGYFFENSNVEVSQIDWLPLVYQSPTQDTDLLYDIHKEIAVFDTATADEFKSTEIALRIWSYDMLSSGNPESFDREGNVYQTLIDTEYFRKLSQASQNYIAIKNDNLINYITELNFDNGYVEYNAMRAKGMANSIMDKLKKDTKAIVWIHNGHAQYAPENIEYVEQTSYDYEGNLESVGTILRDEGIDVYSVGLIFNEADQDASSFFEASVERKTDDSYLEGYINNQTENDIFIDFKTSEIIKNQSYTLDELGSNKYEMNPLEQYDGLIYLDKIEK